MKKLFKATGTINGHGVTFYFFSPYVMNAVSCAQGLITRIKDGQNYDGCEEEETYISGVVEIADEIENDQQPCAYAFDGDCPIF